MRAKLAGFATEVMVPVSLPVPVASPFYFFTAPARIAFAFVALLLISTGGTSVLARGALPGDSLYAVKLRLNENVERTLAYTPEAKAAVDVEHAEERLSEIELLAAQGKTDEAVLVSAGAAVEAKIEQAAATAARFSEEGDETTADQIQSRIASVLLAHADILDAQAESFPEEPKRGLRALSFTVSYAVNDANKDAQVMSDEDTATIALNREASVATRITALTEALAAIDTAPLETKEQLDVELAEIQTDYAAARALSVDKEYEDAASAYAELDRRTALALALVASAERIEEKTGKEVVITFDGEPLKEEANVAAMEVADTATTMMLMSAPTPTENGEVEMQKMQRSKASERPFQFFVRARTSE